MNQINKKTIIPIFFAVDDGYAPFLGVTLESMFEKASKNYFYNINVLNNGINDEYKEMLMKYQNSDYCKIDFVNVNERINAITELHTRDYYTNAIYYRLFIADLFPEYDKALYLDADIIILDDISKLYNNNIKNHYLGVICDDVVNSCDEFKNYTLLALGVKADQYFNSGILVMNLNKLRKDKIYERFVKMLAIVKFIVAPDQDYLNVICKDKVKYLDKSWNRSPLFIDANSPENPKIVHFKLTAKPWHYSNIKYADEFWKYARRTTFYEIIKNMLENYTEEHKRKDLEIEKSLKKLATLETTKENRYVNLVIKEA